MPVNTPGQFYCAIGGEDTRQEYGSVASSHSDPLVARWG